MPRRSLVLSVAALFVAAGTWNLLPHPATQPQPAAAAVEVWPDPALSHATPSASLTPTADDRPTASPTAPSHTASTAPGTSAPTIGEACLVGEPKRLRIPTLAVDAPFERIGLDPKGRRDASGQAPLGTPTDRTKAGWYAAGPRPGSGTGTVLIDGHTYRNGSAIFKDDFAARIATGQLIQLRQDNGSVCSYRITQVWREISSATAYPRLIASQHLYDFGGPERLLLATCGGTWDPAIGNYDDINVVLAVPVPRS